MPAQSTLSNDEKAKVKAAVNSPANKILTAALARIYYAYPNPNEWSYTGLQGALERKMRQPESRKGCSVEGRQGSS